MRRRKTAGGHPWAATPSLIVDAIALGPAVVSMHRSALLASGLSSLAVPALFAVAAPVQLASWGAYDESIVDAIGPASATSTACDLVGHGRASPRAVGGRRCRVGDPDRCAGTGTGHGRRPPSPAAGAELTLPSLRFLGRPRGAEGTGRTAVGAFECLGEGRLVVVADLARDVADSARRTRQVASSAAES